MEMGVYRMLQYEWFRVLCPSTVSYGNITVSVRLAQKIRFSPMGSLVQFRSYQDDRVSYFLTPIDRSFQKASEFLGS